MARVLVIEDNDGVRGILCEILRRGGHETVAAGDGRDGVRLFIEAGVFDLVITDLIMPRQEGLATVQVLRELVPEIPIVAISGAGLESWRPLLHHDMRGPDRTIAKPFRVEEILTAVRELLADFN